jgi:hypothetical protein
VADQLDRDGIDAGGAGELAQRQLGQLAVVAAREVLPYAADLGCYQMEIVEDPLRGGGDEVAAPNVVGQRAVGRVEQSRVLLQPRITAVGGAARVGIDRQTGAERSGALFELLDRRQLVAQRLVELRWRSTEPAKPGW